MKLTADHSRVTPEGISLGKVMARAADIGQAYLNSINEPASERCKTCAFRAGTVPNGCIQTQFDVYKAVFELVPFMCHQKCGEICAGWFSVVNVPGIEKFRGTAPYDFSPEDAL
jgi:hypothetical protein